MLGFPADPNSNNNPAPVSEAETVSQEYPPEWLNSLQERFERFAATEKCCGRSHHVCCGVVCQLRILFAQSGTAGCQA